MRATALDLLAPVTDPALADRAAPLARRSRSAGARGRRRRCSAALPPAERLERLLPVLRDPLRAVRIAAAKALLDADRPAPAAAAQRCRPRRREWRAALLPRADFPETQLQIGGAALTMRDLRLAESAFREAVSLDPQLVDGWVMIARIRAATGDVAAARAALDDALAANPSDATLSALLAQIGSMQGR